LITFAVGITGSITATLIELAPIQEDNFTIPLSSAVIMALVKIYLK